LIKKEIMTETLHWVRIVVLLLACNRLWVDATGICEGTCGSENVRNRPLKVGGNAETMQEILPPEDDKYMVGKNNE